MRWHRVSRVARNGSMQTEYRWQRHSWNLAAGMAVGIFSWFFSLCPSWAEDAAASWKVLDRVVLPEGFSMEGYRVGGLSGIALDSKTGLLWAVSDGRQWDHSVVFRFRLQVDAATGRMLLEPDSVLPLRGREKSEPLDAEGVALWTRDRFLVSHEGSRKGLFSAGVACFSTKTGRVLWSLSLPAYYFPTEEEPLRGVQRNRGFESVSVSLPRSTYLYTAIESPLLQDLSNPRNDSSGPVRLLRFRLSEREDQPAERAYEADRDALFGSVVDVLCIPGTSRLLVMERQLLWPVDPRQRRLRLYEVDFEDPGATVLDGRPAVGGEAIRSLSKRLVFDSARDGLRTPDNLEGLTWGPEVQGKPTLLLVSDDNFSPAQRTEFVLLGRR